MLRALRGLLLTFIVFCLPALLVAKNGLLELDEFSFDKILNKFDIALVKFDVAYPYGEKHDAFAAVALEAREVDELLVADVNVKDYGDKDNEALAEKYGASKENFPAVRLLIKGRKDPIEFDSQRDFTAEELRRFVVQETGLYLSLPGCVRQMDLLAVKFIKADPDVRHIVMKEAEQLFESLPKKHITSGGIYILNMKKILEKGDSFVNTEALRLKKLQSEKMSLEKKKQVENRFNILQSFAFGYAENKKNEEL